MDVRNHCKNAWGFAKRACGNSRTLAIAYKIELLGLLDEAKILPWSDFIGTTHAGRVTIVITGVFIALRLITYEPVQWKA